MNQVLKKTSFVSGLILLLSPIIFSSVLTLVSGLPKSLITFSSDQIIFYVIFLIVSILEVIFFIKIFKAYRSHEPYAYFIIYFLGILTTLAVGIPPILGLCFSLLLGAHLYLQIIKIVFLLILLFALSSFCHQKENFFTTANPVEVRKNVLILLLLTAVIGVASYYIGAYFSERLIFPYFLPAIISLALVPWLRKKVASGILLSFIFLPGFYIVATHLVLKIFAFYAFFQVIKFF